MVDDPGVASSILLRLALEDLSGSHVAYVVELLVND
jgi:hypothetical protein